MRHHRLLTTTLAALVLGATAVAAVGATEDRPVARSAATSSTTTEHSHPAGEGTGRQQAGDDDAMALGARGVDDGPTRGAELGAGASDDGGAGPVREVIPGSPGTGADTAPPEPLGVLDRDLVPDGLDLTSFPGAPPVVPSGAGSGGPGSLAVAPGCHVRCISSGVAYPRGFGVEVVVETTVATDLFVSLIADADGDGVHEDSHFGNSYGAATHHQLAFDELAPGRTYHAMAAATDANGHTWLAYGELTTLAGRRVSVSLGDVVVTGGPSGIIDTGLWLGLDGGDLQDASPDAGASPVLEGAGSHVDLELWTIRRWADDICEYFTPEPGTSPQGHSRDACVAWNRATLDHVALDEPPAGATRWSSTTVTAQLRTPTGAGGALPAGYGDPYHFHVGVPVVLTVTYLSGD